MGRGLSKLQRTILVVGYQNEGRLTYPFHQRRWVDVRSGHRKGMDFYLNEIYERRGWDRKGGSTSVIVSRAVSRLTNRGLVEKVGHSEPEPHHDYLLTERGMRFGRSCYMVSLMDNDYSHAYAINR